MTWPRILASFAMLLEYPRPAMSGALEFLQGEIKSSEVEAFGAFIGRTPLHRLEEEYTVLFDLQPDCSLHLGHHIFGEDCRRGAFMAGLAVHYRRRNFSSGDELPDHLPVVLRYLAVASPQPEDQDLVDLILRPSLQKIVSKLAEENPWGYLLRALVEVVERQGAWQGERNVQ